MIQKNSKVRRGFTLVELLVVIAIIIILAALSFMGVGRAREIAQRAGSAAKLRDLSVAITGFTADNSGFLPATRKSGGVYWPQIIWPNIPSSQAFLRPGTKDRPIDPTRNETNGYFAMPDNAAMTPEQQPIRWNYVINGGAAHLPFSEVAATDALPATAARGLSRPLMQISNPSRTVMLADGNGAFWLNGDAKTNSPRIHKWSNGKSNILWFDGSVQMLSPRELRAGDFSAIK